MSDSLNGNVLLVAKTSCDAFQGIDDIPNPQIAESVFIREFLNLIMDPDLPPDVQTAHNLRWLNYAKSPYAPMDVTRNGKVIYTVPPLFDSAATPLSEQGVNGGFRLLIRTVNEQSKVANFYGDQILNAYIANYANKEREINPRIAASWRHILDFYGIAEEVVRVHTGNELGKTPTNQPVSTATPNFGENVDLDEDC